MGQIKKDVIEFVEKSAKEFIKDSKLATNRNEDYIALRDGLFDDCIRVFELGEEVGNFVQWIPRNSSTFVNLSDAEKMALNQAKDLLSEYCHSSNIYNCTLGTIDIEKLFNKILV